MPITDIAEALSVIVGKLAASKGFAAFCLDVGCNVAIIVGSTKFFGTARHKRLHHCFFFLSAANHLEKNEWESYFMLLFYRGRVDEMIQCASDHDMLDHYLMSLSPSVSYK